LEAYIWSFPTAQSLPFLNMEKHHNPEQQLHARGREIRLCVRMRGGVRGRDNRGRGRRQRIKVPDEIRATLWTMS
jgi:hypothetical protein